MIANRRSRRRAANPTAAGRVAHEGTAAADPAALALGSHVRVRSAGEAEARRLGQRVVIVQLLLTGLGAQDGPPACLPVNRRPSTDV